jgi:hypothetical protein
MGLLIDINYQYMNLSVSPVTGNDTLFQLFHAVQNIVIVEYDLPAVLAPHKKACYLFFIHHNTSLYLKENPAVKPD